MQRLQSSAVRLRSVSLVAVILSGAGLAAAAALSSLPLSTTLNDFLQPGTQPNTILQPIEGSANCAACHGGYDEAQEPYTRWAASMMAQSTRDPIFHAALAIANQDASQSGELCLRCHAPGAWLDGRSTPADGSGLDPMQGDFDGVTCHVCHRLVDPFYQPGANPPVDKRILALLDQVPFSIGGGQYIIDPNDNRRGPFDLGPSFFYHDWRQSPFHRESLLCANCHEVSNPTLSRQPNGDYTLNVLNTPHPTQDKNDEFPIERTFSEWSKSDFGKGPVEMGGRFGGNITAVSTCQDCHMPKTTGTACQPALGGAVRNDLPRHDFNGSNSWVLDSVRSLYPDSETGLTTASVAAAHARNTQMLQNAADLSGWLVNGNLVVRVVNQSGHKLPTGYAEGRRMWLNVKFYDVLNTLVAERGAYDGATASLTSADTRVYESKLGLDANQSVATGLPAGESFHFVLNNKVYKDNRIPPRGFTNAGFDAVQATPVAASYAEERYWDDTTNTIPVGAVRATITLFHQTSSKEYVEFLRDSNTTNGDGLLAYNQWVTSGKSAPVLMQTTSVVFATAGCEPPINYGLAKRRTNGDLPNVTYNGQPSLLSNNFNIVIEKGGPGQSGILFWSFLPDNQPFHGGTLLLASTLYRRGTFVFDGMGKAQLSIAISPGMVGSERNYQSVFRDLTAPDGYGVTNALHVDFCP